MANRMREFAPHGPIPEYWLGDERLMSMIIRNFEHRKFRAIKLDRVRCMVIDERDATSTAHQFKTKIVNIKTDGIEHEEEKDKMNQSRWWRALWIWAWTEYYCLTALYTTESVTYIHIDDIWYLLSRIEQFAINAKTHLRIPHPQAMRQFEQVMNALYAQIRHTGCTWSEAFTRVVHTLERLFDYMPLRDLPARPQNSHEGDEDGGRRRRPNRRPRGGRGDKDRDDDRGRDRDTRPPIKPPPPPGSRPGRGP